MEFWLFSWLGRSGLLTQSLKYRRGFQRWVELDGSNSATRPKCASEGDTK